MLAGTTADDEGCGVSEGRRQRLDDLDLPVGKRARLRRLLYTTGPANGTLLLLLADQALESGPTAFPAGPATARPARAIELAGQGGVSAVATGIGPAERDYRAQAGRVPLLLKLNGKTSIPPDDEALAPLNATVEDAVRLGADGVVYTLYPGSPAQFEDFTQLSQVRQDCQRFGMSLIVLAAPRGAAVERKGGTESLYALEYAAMAAAELGADLVILDAPLANPQRDPQMPKPYTSLQVTAGEALRRVVDAAAGVPVILHADGASEPEALLAAARARLDAGAAGLAYGHGLWSRPIAEAADLLTQLGTLLAEFASQE